MTREGDELAIIKEAVAGLLALHFYGARVAHPDAYVRAIEERLLELQAQLSQ